LEKGCQFVFIYIFLYLNSRTKSVNTIFSSYRKPIFLSRDVDDDIDSELLLDDFTDEDNYIESEDSSEYRSVKK